MTSLVVVGAGPKAVAVAAKAAALRAEGLPAPDVTVVEPRGVAANWRSVGGWTDGLHRLGTSPHKDIGYPYRTRIARGADAAVDRRLLALSWTGFLTAQGTYADWVDRGCPSPPHDQWASYLAWAAAESGMTVTPGVVEGLTAADSGWQVSVGGAAPQVLSAEAVLVTGPGRSDQAMSDDPSVLSVSRFWELAAARGVPSNARVAVIGGGETAASALDELVRHDVFAVSVISPAPTIFTRGESYFENALYSDPTRWAMLSQEERRDVIRRTDRGVFSTRVQESLLAESRIHHIRGRVTRIVRGDAGLELTLTGGRYPQTPTAYDLVVDARGGDALWFLDLLDSGAADRLELAIGGPASVGRIEDSIRYDLSVGGLEPKLFLPNLAGMAQGPGFANLSCLGELSDRILSGPVRGAVGSARLGRAWA
ncbi:SidA/IucD/PvdA family monooxygenase [Tsukamurella sp. 8F]|uniref:SidA/IucD/PvdA family monooxygenase n=1 Tax=unclassified Tsukamurella TaxID=2633480 RepID=UPI0023B9FF32|nr:MULTISPECIES: SidA/IucD/PvdA family monooxygenase [unclassified Tsukamurella]MDF0529312.1 SidA/IucD/PvdA family monooxygenase [Tsukamurella sp. 8J]MDF0587181.1 SidA/IucD/PvdA family monooxygenase [Tsukamurella sp. 8F]